MVGWRISREEYKSWDVEMVDSSSLALLSTNEFLGLDVDGIGGARMRRRDLSV